MKPRILIFVLALSLVASACNKDTSRQTNTVPNPTPTPVSVTPNPSEAPTPDPSVVPPPSQTPTIKPTPTPAPTPTPPPAPKTVSFLVTADDFAAIPNAVTVNKGDKVNLAITVKTTNVYYGGLDFRSTVVNSGTILPGASKTLTFTADQSFVLEGFWPSSNVKKQSKITVTVK